MPGRSLEPTMDTVPTLKFGSLKGHKNLPRRNHVAAESNHTRSSEQQQRIRRRSDQITYTSADRIKSWIPDPSSIRVIPVVGAPLTPPINFRDDFQSWIDDAALRKREFPKTDYRHSIDATPLIQQSPPTPEASPSKKIYRAQAVASFSSSRIAIESRTESFKTAQENQSSEDEGGFLDSPSLHPSRQKWLRTLGPSKRKDVGLGLGLESEDEEPTPQQSTPRNLPESQDFVTFDGAWGEVEDGVKTSDVLEDPMKPTSITNVRRRSRIVSEPVLDSPTLGKGTDASLKKFLSLRERVERTRHDNRDPSLEKFADQINWPLKDDVIGIDSELRDMNNKRLSQASTTSTVVEAMVFDSPPRRRQTLRRTSKMPDLNTPPQQSNRKSSMPNDTSLQRRLRRSGSPDQELRKSFASASPDSVVPSAVNSRQDTAPVIPDRRSSLQSSASGSKRLSRTFSLTSRQQSSRPTTAPEESVGYFDIPRPRDRRTMSVVIHAPTPLKPESNVLKEDPTSVIAEATPPSMPTSSTEAPSKSTSVTSAGLDAFYAPATPNPQQPSATLHLTDAQNAQNSNTDQPGMGEWTAMRPRSTLVTPFSLRSAHSSTPGTLEVNEATAISIYPHTNKSILVIQQMAGGSNSSPKERSAIIAGNANIALPGPMAPVIHHESPPEPPRDILNSPLQNPRDPPQPPDFKIIPPTPANGSGSLEKRRSPPRTPIKSKRFSAPVSTLKRAFSARRPQSESFVTPFSRTFSLRGTAGAPGRRTQPDDEPQSKLHPFWRPRDYDNGSDSDSEFGNTGFLNGSRVQSQSSRDVPPRRTMSLTRRLTNSIRLPHAARRQRPSSMFLPSDQNQYEFRRPSVFEYEESKGEAVPSQGYQVQFVGFRGLADILERRREAKAEGRREQRRQRLRDKIGAVKNGSDRSDEVQEVGG